MESHSLREVIILLSLLLLLFLLSLRLFKHLESQRQAEFARSVEGLEAWMKARQDAWTRAREELRRIGTGSKKAG